MPDEISRETFERLVELAALELSQTEAETLRRELNNQLNAIHELEAIDVAGVPIASHGVPYTAAISQALRPDAVLAHVESDDILAQAPEVEDRYFVVPDIPHTELGGEQMNDA